MSIRGNGLLAIWSDVTAAVETDYRHWFSREHVVERVGVDGFLAGRVFRSLEPELRRYFFAYELADSSAVVSASYLARLNSPTPWSQRMMPILQNFARGGGLVVARAGLGSGGVVAPLRFEFGMAERLADSAAQQALVHRLASLDGVATAWLMRVDQQATTVPTKEKSLRRSAEGGFDALLCIEGVAAEHVGQAARSTLADELAGTGQSEAPLFALCFALDRRGAGLPANFRITC